MKFTRFLDLRLAAAFVVGALLSQNAQAALIVGPTGLPTQTFAAAPGVADWSTVASTGASADIGTAAALDTRVQTLTAAGIATALPTIATSANNTLATWMSGSGGKLHTASTGNAATILMATLQNGSGSTLTTLDFSYTLAVESAPVAPAEQIPGHQAYFSLTGAANSWTAIPNFTTATAGPLTATLNLGSWTDGSLMYILWADDNADQGTEGRYSIDDFKTGPAVPPVVDPNPSVFALTASNDFESDAVGNIKRIAAGFPTANVGEPLAFRGTYTGASGIADHPGNGEHQIQLNNGRLGNGDATAGTTAFQFDPVDVTGQTGVRVQADIRTEGRASGFEDADELHIFVEGSSDGVNYTLLGSLADLVGSTADTNDVLDQLDSDGPLEEVQATGAFSHLDASFNTSGLTHVRLVVDADNDSANEFIMIDNVSISPVPEPGSFVLAGIGLLGIVIGLRGRRQA